MRGGARVKQSCGRGAIVVIFKQNLNSQDCKLSCHACSIICLMLQKIH